MTNISKEIMNEEENKYVPIIVTIDTVSFHVVGKLSLVIK